jgi:proteic killer suppression protein
MNLPGYRLHPLRGDRRGAWAVAVSGNWRLVFEFEDDDVIAVDLVDYH